MAYNKVYFQVISGRVRIGSHVNQNKDNELFTDAGEFLPSVIGFL